MPASSGDNKAAYSGFGVLSSWWRALVDGEPWLFSLLPRAGVAMSGGHHTRMSAQPLRRVNQDSC